MAKKKGLLLDNQDWLDEFIPVLVDEMLKLGITTDWVAKYLARIFYSLCELEE